MNETIEKEFFWPAKKVGISNRKSPESQLLTVKSGVKFRASDCA